jgi:hypothetical protein
LLRKVLYHLLLNERFIVRGLLPIIVFKIHKF